MMHETIRSPQSTIGRVDSFVHEWRKTEAKGEVYIVRYTDDVVIAVSSRLNYEG